MDTVAELKSLARGEYRVGVSIMVKGDYIEEAQRNECHGDTFVFRLLIP